MPGFHKIELPNIPDLIIKQILDLLEEGKLSPGDQLPSEVQLQKTFGVAKQQLKAAFKKLELYGVLETKPQSGTYLADINVKILKGLLTNILNIQETMDPASLYRTRGILEIYAVESAASRITDRELQNLRYANNEFLRNIGTSRAVEDDIFFHLEVVRNSGNSTLIALYSFIARPLLRVWEIMDQGRERSVTEERLRASVVEHDQIIDCLEKRDPRAAADSMRSHLVNVFKEYGFFFENQEY